MALTRITQGVIKPNENYDTHNINSTGIVTATALNISGDASIGGVLTYEDVTNVDSVGLVTARSGIRIGGHILPTVNEAYDLGSADKKIRHLFLSDNSLKFVDSSDTEHPLSVDSGRLKFAGGMLLGSDIQLDPISGIITATNFVKGDGSPLGGVVSDGQANTVGGTDAGLNLSAGTLCNTLFGAEAGKEIIAGSSVSHGDNNTFIGFEAGESCTTGYENVAIGYLAGNSFTTLPRSTLVGAQAGKGSTDGNDGVGYKCVGGQGGGASGYGNSGYGKYALSRLTSGLHNTCVGAYAGNYLTDGDRNTMVGENAGHMVNGNDNVIIGQDAAYDDNNSPFNTGSNCIIIGSHAMPTGQAVSNEITLGDTNITKFRIPGIGVTFASSGNHITGVTTFSGGLLTFKGQIVQHNGYHWYGFHGSNLYADINASHWALKASGSMNAFISANSSGGTAGRVHLSGGSSGGRVYVNGPGGVELHHSGSSDKKLETTSGGITVTGSVTDSKGDLRRIPVDTYNSSHTLGAQNAGETVYISSGGVTIPSGTFTAGDAITIINNSGSDQTITCSAVTTYLAGDTSSKSSLTLKGRGMATFYFASSSEVYGSGAGLE